MDSTQAAKNLAEAAHALLDTYVPATGYVEYEAGEHFKRALDAYDERVAFEAGKPDDAALLRWVRTFRPTIDAEFAAVVHHGYVRQDGTVT